MQVRGAIERLGPAYVKVAQAVSTRVDLLSPAYLLEIERLQDRVPPFPTSEVRAWRRLASRPLPLQAPPHRLAGLQLIVVATTDAGLSGRLDVRLGCSACYAGAGDDGGRVGPPAQRGRGRRQPEADRRRVPGPGTACTAPCLPCILRHIGTGYDVHLVAVSRGS